MSVPSVKERFTKACNLRWYTEACTRRAIKVVCRGEQIQIPEMADEKSFYGKRAHSRMAVSWMELEARRRGVHINQNVWPRWKKDDWRISSGWFLVGDKHGAPVPRMPLAWLSRVFSRRAKGPDHFRKERKERDFWHARCSMQERWKEGRRSLRKGSSWSSVGSKISTKAGSLRKMKRKLFRMPSVRLRGIGGHEQTQGERTAVRKRARAGVCFVGRYSEKRSRTHQQQRSGRADPEILGGRLYERLWPSEETCCSTSRRIAISGQRISISWSTNGVSRSQF